jgi:hypothetical protein
MKIDNPEHREHYRYHLIVDRVATAVIGVFLSLLSVEIAGTLWAIFLPLAVVSVAMYASMAIVLAIGVGYFLYKVAVEFFTGY